MKWLLLALAAVSLFTLRHLWSRRSRADVSDAWLAEDQRRRHSLGYDGMRHTGQFARYKDLR